MSAERLEELLLRWEELTEAGQGTSAAELCRDCPELIPELQRRIDVLRGFARVAEMAGPQELCPGSATLAAGSEPIPGYRLVQRLGRGGFGEVWKAEGPEGPVALKFIPRAEQGAKVEWRSLEVLRHLTHPNLLGIYATWQLADFFVVAAELADGTLLDRMQEDRGQGLLGIPRDELLGYLRDAAEGVDYLQKRYIQHRDIKPQNLLLVRGRVKVGDFGLSRLLAHSITGHTGSLTLAYAAPEFFDGRTTRYSDQYSLAVTYCQLRGGRLPFEGTPAAVVASHLHRRPDLSMLPAEERPAVARALAKRPQDRWPSCGAFVEAVARGQADCSPSPRGRGQLWQKRWIWWAAALALLALALFHGFLQQARPVSVRPFKSVPDAHLIRSVSISPVGAPLNRLVALSNGSGAPVLWAADTGEPLRKLPYAGGPCAALAPLELPLGVTGHDDGKVVLWDLAAGKELRRFDGHKQSVGSVAFSADAKHILSGSCDETIRLWDRRSGKQIHCLRGHKGFVTSVAFDPTGRRALSGSWDGTVRLWDLDAGAELKQFSHPSRVHSVSFSPDGRHAVSGGRDRTVRVWDVESGTEVSRFEGPAYEILSVNFVRFNRVLVAAGPTVRLLETTTGQELLRVPDQPSVVQSVGLTGSEGRHYLAIGTTENGIRLCELPDGLFNK
jgi:serine/threonine protein kinase